MVTQTQGNNFLNWVSFSYFLLPLLDLVSSKV